MLAPPDLIVYLCLVNRSSSDLSVPLGNTAITAPAPPHFFAKAPHTCDVAGGCPSRFGGPSLPQHRAAQCWADDRHSAVNKY